MLVFAKLGLNLLAGIGIGKVAGSVFTAVAPQTTRFGKIAVTVGATAVAWAVGDAVKPSVDRRVDEVANAVNEIRKIEM